MAREVAHQDTETHSPKGEREWIAPRVQKYDIRSEVNGPNQLLGGDLIILGGS